MIKYTAVEILIENNVGCYRENLCTVILYLRRSYSTVRIANKDARRIYYSLTLYERIYYRPHLAANLLRQLLLDIMPELAYTRVNILFQRGNLQPFLLLSVHRHVQPMNAFFESSYAFVKPEITSSRSIEVLITSSCINEDNYDPNSRSAGSAFSRWLTVERWSTGWRTKECVVFVFVAAFEQRGRDCVDTTTTGTKTSRLMKRTVPRRMHRAARASSAAEQCTCRRFNAARSIRNTFRDNVHDRANGSSRRCSRPRLRVLRKLLRRSV